MLIAHLSTEGLADGVWDTEGDLEVEEEREGDRVTVGVALTDIVNLGQAAG